MDLNRLYNQVVVADPQGWEEYGERHYEQAQAEPNLRTWCRDSLSTAAVMASLREYAFDEDTEGMPLAKLNRLGLHGGVRQMVWQKSSESDLMLPAYAEIILPKPEELSIEKRTLLGPDVRPARLWVEEAVAKAQRKPQVVVPEMPQPAVIDPMSMEAKLAHSRAIQRPGTGAKDLNAMMAILGQGPQKPAQPRPQQAPALDMLAAQKALKKVIKKAPDVPLVPSKDDDLPDVGGGTPGNRRPPK